jgi:hypothetical protein
MNTIFHFSDAQISKIKCRYKYYTALGRINDNIIKFN